MPVTLHLDVERWRAWQDRFVASAGGPGVVVPVIKGNGYGPGRAVVAAESARLGVATVAVGTYAEVADVEAHATADLLVLTPWGHGEAPPLTDRRVLHTVSRLADLRALAETGARPRVIVEVLTSMRRYGIEVVELGAVAPLLQGVDFEGWALHLPLSRADTLAEGRALGAAARTVAPGPLWLSHVDVDALGAVGPDVRLRTGTRLWLGGHTMRWTATVLDVHRLRRGQRYGYRQRRAVRDATLVVAAGGTSHGIGLETPSPAVTLRQRAVAVGVGASWAVGRALSPYRLDGKRMTFAEPPHMQASMLWAPPRTDPRIGDELDLVARATTTTPDVLVPDA